MLERILLGDNPFIGVDHLSQDKARQTLARLDTEKTAGVMKSSFQNGADGLVFSTHPTILATFQHLKATNPELSFDMYPLFPYAQGYVRMATEKGTVGMVTELMQQLTWTGKFKALLGSSLSAITKNPYKMLETVLDIEIDSFRKVAPPRANLKGIFLHEIIVDLGLSLELTDLFDTYIDHVTKNYNVKAGLVTRNFSRMIKFFEKADLPFDKVMFMTPFNKIGFQMNPSRQSCEDALASRSDLDVIAMSILSSGLLDVKEAVDYIGNLTNLRSVVVGVSREEHVVSTFSRLNRLKKDSTS